MAGVALPTVLKPCGSALQELHCQLRNAYKCSAAWHTQCTMVHITKQCGNAHKVLIVQRRAHNAVGLLDPVRLFTGVGRAILAKCDCAPVRLHNNTLAQTAH